MNCKNGVSSCELARDLGVTQKTAWFMAHRLRFALKEGGFGKLSGEVEADESFIGGKSRNMHKSARARRITGTGGKDKAVVFGVLQRGGKVRAIVVPDRQKQTVQPLIKDHVDTSASLYTDDHLGYKGLSSEYAHQVIDHAIAYVDGKIHTNGLENFWSLLKRGLGGTYISVEPFHLFRYLDEEVFRYNNRKWLNDCGRFRLALSQITGKRLTYEHLTGKDLEPQLREI